MFYYSLQICLLIITIYLIGIKPTDQLALDKNIVEELVQNSTRFNSISVQEDASATLERNQLALDGPFILLLSSDTISVAQLPMILYGNMTDIYRLDPNERPPQDANDYKTSVVVQPDDKDRHEDTYNSRSSNGGQGRETTIGRKRQDGDGDGDEPRADGREYEQMPATHQLATTTTVNSALPTMSLGKSEWQQIANSADKRDKEEVSLPQSTTQKNMNRKNSEEDGDEKADERAGETVLGSPRRRRRSNEGNNISFGNESNSNNRGTDQQTTATSDNALEPSEGRARRRRRNSRGVNRAKESDAQNVTSAQSGNEEETGIPSLEPTREDGAKRAVLTEDGGDKTSHPQTGPGSSQQSLHSSPSSSAPGVKFSDFDVHMALGYAFVTDSAGRIHRFRLPLKGKQSASSTLANNQRQQGSVIFSSNVKKFVESDDANAIDAGLKFEFAASHQFESKESKITSNSRSNSSAMMTTTTTITEQAKSSNSVQSDTGADDHHTTASKNSGENSNDVNEFRRHEETSEDVTHEHSGDAGQHPTTSGGWRGLFAGTNSRVSEALRSLAGVSQKADRFEQSNLEADSLKARVIWSRSKRRLAATAAASRLLALPRPTKTDQAAGSGLREEKKQPKQQLVNVDGASFSSSGESNQMANERSRDSQEDEDQVGPQNDEPVGGEKENQSEQQPNGSIGQQQPSLGTELAVDWINNLLFVLDKCRLLVMDFDGNNELVLIDDFTNSNRPVDIKVDPINDFLFWLQVGKFHNTIYKLDLSVLSMPSATQKLVSNTLRLRQSLNAANDETTPTFDTSDLVPLVSHHYAHPIITNLPRHARLFLVDHKHSRIYVPLIPQLSVGYNNEADTNTRRLDNGRDDAEIFASNGDVTHLNNTELDLASMSDEKNCSQNDLMSSSNEFNGGQILAYNLDGTDMGPLRTSGEKSHISNADNMQDLTLDAQNNLLYWLTNNGKDLIEEFRENSTIQPAQHYLNGRSHSKLIYFDNNGFNQPQTSKSKFNVRKIIHILSSSISANRPTRSDGVDLVDEDNSAFSLKVRHLESQTSRFSRNAPVVILAVTCLIVITIYLTYALLFQRSSSENELDAVQCRDGSISGGSSSIGESHGIESNLNGFINSSTISRWIAGPSTRSTDTSIFNRNASTDDGGRMAAYDIESTNYETSNAVDEHYRDSIANADRLFGNLNAGRLANLTEWPSDTHDKSNKLYVPVEVLQDDALSSICRISIDQLEIERRAPLGEGHFGTVLQGKLRCTLHERSYFLDKPQEVPLTAPISPDSLAPRSSVRTFGVSSASSGHGSSSSTSCEFTTANSMTEPTNDEDYLTPRNQLNSAASDYCDGLPQSSSSRNETSCIEYNDTRHSSVVTTSSVKTKMMVAIKKLKDNASPDEKRDFLQEAKLLANFDHPNIVHLIGICLDRGSTLIVMELMLGGDLIRYMQENRPNSMNNFSDNLTYDDLLKICLDIANGCCYLEDMDYIHRDLAARNCLVSSSKREERVVKLADFGLARDIYKDSYYKKLNDSAMPLKWMAPECLIEQKFTKKSDVWSFGVVMWEVISYCQDKPYSGIEPFFIKEHLASGARLRKPDHCDEDMYKLMNQCWQMEPEKRPTFHECRTMLIEIRNNLKL